MSRRLLAHAPTLPYNRRNALESNTLSIESKKRLRIPRRIRAVRLLYS
jgi:hypothetical protein